MAESPIFAADRVDENGVPIPPKPPLYNEMIPPGGAARVGLKISSPCDGPWSSRFGLFASRSAQALSSEFDAMGVVNEAVENGVGVSGVADHVMPCGQGKLRGDDRG